MGRAGVKADYQEVKAESTPEAVVIEDLDLGGCTITNDAAAVVAELHRLGLAVGSRRVLYYDTDRVLSELVHDGEGHFVCFAAATQPKPKPERAGQVLAFRPRGA